MKSTLSRLQLIYKLVQTRVNSKSRNFQKTSFINNRTNANMTLSKNASKRTSSSPTIPPMTIGPRMTTGLIRKLSIETLIEEFKPVALDNSEFKSDYKTIIGLFHIFGLSRFQSNLKESSHSIPTSNKALTEEFKGAVFEKYELEYRDVSILIAP